VIVPSFRARESGRAAFGLAFVHSHAFRFFVQRDIVKASAAEKPDADTNRSADVETELAAQS
jgi:hypothetical protein